MIEAAGRQVLSGVVIEQASVCFQRVYEKSVQRVLAHGKPCELADRQAILQKTRANRCGHLRLAVETGHRSISLRSQCGENGSLRGGRTKNVCIRQQGNRILGVLPQASEGEERKGFVFLDREAGRAPKLVAAQGILGRLALTVRLSWIEDLTGLQRLSASKRVSGVHGIIAEISVEAAVQLIRAGFRDDVDRRATRSTEISRIIAPVNLKLLNRILAQRETHTARVIIRFSAVDGDAIASAVAAVKGQAALRCLLDSKILVGSQPGGVPDTRSQKSECQIITTVNGELSDILLRECIRLAPSLGLHGGKFGRHFHLS